MTEKLILDASCGPRMMWFDKEHPDAIYMDIRRENITCSDGKYVEIQPDIVGDFRDIPFSDNTFRLVVLDPPHLSRAGKDSILAAKYGRLFPTWETDLKAGFDECMRVLKPAGILIFKWNEYQIPVSRILDLFGQEPLFGHRSGKQSKTHWLTFMKPPA